MLRRPMLGLPALAMLCACASPPPVGQAPATTIELQRSPTGASAAIEMRAPSKATSSAPEAITVKLPTDVACTYKSAQRPFAATLAFSTSGPRYVKLNGSAKSLSASLPTGPGTLGWVADVEVGGVLFRGYAAAESIALHPSMAFMFEELFIPSGSVTVTVRKAEQGKITASVPPPLALDTMGRALEATVPCGVFRLEEGSFDARKSVAAPEGPSGVLHGASVGISVHEDGPIVAYAKLGRETNRWVEILATGKKRTRIAWELEEGLVVGWVAKSAVSKRKPVEAYGTGGLGLTGVGAGGVPETLRCRHEVPLHAEAAGVEETVGRVRAQTAMIPGNKAPTRVEIQFLTEEISLVEGAVLFVTPDAIADCALE